MSVVIEGINKPENCLGCVFNRSDCWCSITNGEIDRDDYSCSLPCPIKPLDSVLDKIKEEIDWLSDSECNGHTVTIYSWKGMKKKVFEIIDKYKESEDE